MLKNYFLRVKNIINSKSRVIVLIIVVLYSIILLFNNLSNNISKIHVDEKHTIEMAFKSIAGENYESLRVGESSRLLAKMIYPFAIYHMNKCMGGEHYVTKWKYSGGFYLKKNFTHIYNSIENQDANIQDFWFAMRFACGLLVILSFFLSSLLIYKNESFFAALIFLVISLYSSHVIETLKIFYTESAMLISINLIICYYYFDFKKKWLELAALALIIVFSVNIKLSGVLLLLPIFHITYLKELHKQHLYFYEILALFTILFFGIFTINIPNNWLYLEEQLSNIYHYQTGHLITQPAGFYQLKSILRELMPWVLMAPIIIIIFLLKNKRKYQNYLIYTFLTISVIYIAQLTGARFFVKRNLTTIFVLLSFSTAILFGRLINNLHNKWISYSLYALTLSFMAFQFNINFIDYSDKLFSENIEGYAIVDLKQEDHPNGTAINSMPEEYMLKKDLEKLENQFSGFNYVFVNRIKNNKQYTNFILPRKFNLIKREGSYFLFKRKVISYNR